MMEVSNFRDKLITELNMAGRETKKWLPLGFRNTSILEAFR